MILGLIIVGGLLMLVALMLLLVVPSVGLAVTFVARPLVDATWNELLIGDLNLPRIMSVAVPSVVLGYMLLIARGEKSLKHVPLLWLWVLYSLYCVVFSINIGVNEGLLPGLEIFFRHISGIVGFYMLQAFAENRAQLKRILLALLLAGLFPCAVGCYQALTGVHWTEAAAEGLTRSVGLYHDAYTVRFYMLQTLLSLYLYVSIGGGRHLVVAPLGVAYAGACLVVVYFAFSKAAFAILALWLLIWVMVRRDLLSLTLGCVLVLLALLVGGDVLLSNLWQLFHKEIGVLQGTVPIERSFQGRWYGWFDIVEHWQQLSPIAQWFGSGERATGAHNDYLQLLMHGGIFGLSLYLLLLTAMGFAALRAALFRPNPYSCAALMALAMWGVDSIGLVPSAYPGYQWFVWGVVGLGLRQDQRLRRQHFSRPAGRLGYER